MTPRRGDILLVDFDPARPGEANKVRPSIVVTNDLANERGSSVVVVPLTSNTVRIYPFQLLLPSNLTGLDRDSKAQVELIRSVSRSRLESRVGSVVAEVLEQLDARIRLHLGLS